MFDTMLQQHAENGGSRIEIGRRVGFAIPPRRMRKVIHRRQRERHATFRRRNRHEPIAGAQRHLPIERACPIHRLERELHIDGLACGIALVGLQRGTETAIGVAIGGQRGHDRQGRPGLEFRGEAAALQKPCIAQDEIPSLGQHAALHPP